ncbi:N-acetyltransferase [Phyllobacterium sp. LjRoot231]
MGDMRFRNDAYALGCERDGEIVGAVIFDTFGSSDCLIHVVTNGKRRWFNRELATRVCAFPFTQCGFKRITALISADNEPSLRFIKGFGGFVQEGVMRQGGTKGEDLIMFGLLRRDCRWLPLAF